MPATSRFSKTLILLLVLLILIASSVLAQPVNAAEPPPMKKILILNAQTPEFPIHTIFTKAVKDEMLRLGYTNIEYYSEYLELNLYQTEPNYIDSLSQLLKQKYTTNKPDVIMVNGVYGAPFMIQYGKQLFPGVPVVITSNDFEGFSDMQLPADYSGISGIMDLSKSIQLILNNHSGTKKIDIIIGASEIEVKLMATFKKKANFYSDKVTFEYLNELSFPQILETVHNTDPHTAILVLYIYKDAAGTNFVPSKASREVTQSANAPVYGIYEPYLGVGIVGGNLLSFAVLGKKAAAQAIDFLAGNRTYDKIIEKVPASAAAHSNFGL
ncbi:hypothetical protein EHS13_30480 [Paenibacillus psychroresistens]|uniref:ABC transporter substrate-binding protein n=1 Tax=Paenibacillus psychroresistens TaxID=1778678 RepID=A0A6B8RUT9_9BACL|nr:hypothetical protein [Paenibacillus psychroresistens]QGQ98898.1 hypothetical protein EHS13_30480 [Paenibacillus psychroresistens]